MKNNKYTQKTFSACRKAGRIIATTEHWNYHAGKRIDLFGFADAIALQTACNGRQKRIVAIQICGPSNFCAHLKKIKSNPNVRLWLDCGGQVELWTWKKLKTKGKRKWFPRVKTVSLSDITEPANLTACAR